MLTWTVSAFVNASAEKCISDHKNPIVRSNLPPQKLLFATEDDNYITLVKNYQTKNKDLLSYGRVEKRSNRAQAIWLPEECLGKILKVVKNLIRFFGYQNKEGIFIYPEEILFLLETNRLEISFNNIYLSIEEAYELLFKSLNFSLNKYKIYRKIANLGYKIVPYNQMIIKNLIKIDKKRKLTEGSDQKNPKKIKVASSSTQNLKNKSKEEDYINNLYKKLQDTKPKNLTNQENLKNPDYYMFTSSKSEKNPDFNIYVCNTNIMDQAQFYGNSSSIFAVCLDDVSFYQFTEVQIPHI